jgi:hypothetical protein
VTPNDIISLPVQSGNATLLFNPNLISEIISSIIILWHDDNFRQELLLKETQVCKTMVGKG